MSSFKVIQNPESFQLSSKWQEVRLSQKGKSVNSNGKAITTAYAGSRYQVICKAQHTKIEYIKRFALGVLRICVGGIFWCPNKVKSLLTRKHKLYVSPLIQNELKKQKTVSDPSKNEQINKEEKSQNTVSSINELGTQNLVNPALHKSISSVELKSVTLKEAQQALEKEMEICPQTMERIKELMPKIANREKGDDLKWMSIGQFFSVFTIPEKPGLVFKIANHNEFGFGKNKLPRGDSERTEERFKNTVRGKQVVMQYDLNLLHIPAAKLLHIESDGYKYAIIAEKRLAFPADDYDYEQKDAYYKKSDSLKPLVKQMVRFISESGDDDVRFSNYPILDQAELGKAVHCGVIDLEWAGHNPIDGLVGGKHRSIGLIGMMPNEALIDTVIKESKKLGLELSRQGSSWSWLKDDAASIKSTQLSKIKTYYRYQEFHKERGIKTGNEPFMSMADIDKLDLNLDETEDHKIFIGKDDKGERKYQSITYCLKDAVEKVIKHINASLEKQNATHVKMMRNVHIPYQNPFNVYQKLGVPGKTEPTLEEEQQFWLNRILNQLREKGFIFSYKDKGRGHGYYVKC